MMIDKEQFKSTYKPFDKEVVVEIIDIFIQEWPERYKELDKNIQNTDFESLRFNAHSLKGVVANFLAEEPRSLARQLEENAKDNIDDNNKQILEKLDKDILQMIEELKELRTAFI